MYSVGDIDTSLGYACFVFDFLKSAGRVVVRIQGGLGNQMHQVALGIAIEKLTNIKVDYIQVNEPRIGRQKNTRRSVDLQQFWQLRDLKVTRYQTFFSSLDFNQVLKKAYPGKSSQVILERDITRSYFQHQDEEIIGLEGYWQSESYFGIAKHEVLDAFRFLSFENSTFKSMQRKISSERNIGVHIRRGDYVTNKRTNKVHGACSLKYFQNALELTLREVNPSNVLVFSDDPEWAKKNLRGPRLSIVSTPALRAWEELLLLSMCSHLILSNSSFSWWGAYLRQNNGCAKPLIVAPSPWFADSRYSTQVFPNWQLLDIDSGSFVD